MTPVCPICGGRLVSVRDRAWCTKPYDLGGCGSFFTVAWTGHLTRVRALSLPMHLTTSPANPTRTP